MLPTMDDFDFENKRIILRVDINSPLEPSTLNILDNWRIKKIIPTLKELEEKNARQIILAHQGRPGKWDFTSLEKHAEELSRLMGREIKFIDDIYGQRAIDEIKNMREGDIILLDNVRKCKEEMEKKNAEEHAKAEMIKKLSQFGDAFINDAFAASHRKQCSLLGFIPVLPSFAGRLMQKEVEMVEKLLKEAERPRVFIFGGGKYENAIDVIDKLLHDGTADKILLGGMSGNVFFEKMKGSSEINGRIEEMIKKYGDKIVPPSDLIESKDIGERTIEIFKKEIEKASSIFISGPMGVFEDEKYAKGTKEILEAIANSQAFSMAGGGHTVAAINMFGLENKFSYISTGGGALERMLMGEKLPVIDALIKFKK
ncbi:MAG TPA: phosphoglycerate kinase [Thermoplasmatales archaeon]|nr:phosphoglycerate kinase [Thermoplasmatales archaeon]